MTPELAPRLRSDRGFERIYRRHVADVYRYALAVLRDPADAEDVTHTTFLNAYRAFKAGDAPRAPANWLLGIAHGICRQRFRHAARRVGELALDPGLEASDADDLPTARDLRRALGRLAFNQRAALVMRELEGRSYAEIASVLGMSVASSETLVFRARRAMREQLEGSLTCRQAEQALSRKLDGELRRAERRPLKAHLRDCRECAQLARKLRAQQAAIRALGAAPLPASLGSFFGGAAPRPGTAGVVVARVTAVTAVAAVAGGAAFGIASRSPGPAEVTVAEQAQEAAAVQPAAREGRLLLADEPAAAPRRKAEQRPAADPPPPPPPTTALPRTSARVAVSPPAPAPSAPPARTTGRAAPAKGKGGKRVTRQPPADATLVSNPAPVTTTPAADPPAAPEPTAESEPSVAVGPIEVPPVDVPPVTIVDLPEPPVIEVAPDPRRP
jgi:RNA polymerase sigma factor (sigma-70 family)